VTGNQEKPQGKSLIFYPQREVIHLRPPSELVTQIVGACHYSQMSTSDDVFVYFDTDVYNSKRSNGINHPPLHKGTLEYIMLKQKLPEI
jgi:hypothetical protein